jgi:hypothetical protein
MLKMKETESVKEYTSKLSHLVNQMRLYGEVVDDSKVVEKMLISLPDKFEAKVAAIEESCDLKNSVVKIASQLADSDEFTIYPSLTERNRAQNRRRRESAPDRRSGSQNRGNAVRSDSKRVSRERRRLELNAPFCFLLKHTVLYFIKTHCFLF